MFDWFWEFLYSISKALFKVCDWLMQCALELVGIRDITIDGNATDFMSYLITSDTITQAIAAISVLSFVILMIFTIFQIIRVVAKEQPGMTPAQVCVKSLKCLLMFMFVPVIMLALTYFLNVFMEAVYKATSFGSSSSIGSFMFVTFGQDGLNDGEVQDFLSGAKSYTSTSTVYSALNHDWDNFNFIFSWIVGAAVMINLSSALLMFVDRAISIVILYLAAPFAISATVIDDGAHFKTWREQVLTKYLTGYGVIIGMNIYILIMGLVTRSTVHFFDNGALNYVAKVLILLGGAITMKKSAALIASLMSQGGANEVNDPAFRGNALASALAAPFKAGRSVANFASDASHFGFGNAVKKGLGFKIDQDYRMYGASKGQQGGGGGGEGGGGSEGSDNQNSNSANYNDDKNKQLNNALEGGNDSKSNGNGGNDNKDNQNSNKNQGANNLVNNAIQNSSNDDHSGAKEENE